MGLFSFLSKNKQGRTAEDSGRFYSKDDDAAIGERARAKRASSAGASAGAGGRRSANDPMLPEKKRARRRLVGAVALALAAAVGLPMLLDSEPKPLAGDIAIQIPSKDKAAPLPVPGAAPDAAAPVSPDAAPAGARDKAVAAADSVDKGEEIIDAPPAPVRKPDAKLDAKQEAVKAKPEAKPAPKAEHKDLKTEARLAERERADRERAERADRDRERADKADRERAERTARLEKQRADEKARKLEDKPVKPVHSDTRALAILEGKGADKTAGKDKDKPADTGAPKVTLQVAAMSSQEKAAELQARLSGAGISSHTEKFGELVRVKVGPLSKDDAERVRAKLNKMGL
jgi:DedD protein